MRKKPLANAKGGGKDEREDLIMGSKTHFIKERRN